MKKYIITKDIMLSFLSQYNSTDFRIDPQPNEFLVIKDGIVYLEHEGKLIESNNTVGSMAAYIKDGSIKPIEE